LDRSRRSTNSIANIVLPEPACPMISSLCGCSWRKYASIDSKSPSKGFRGIDRRQSMMAESVADGPTFKHTIDQGLARGGKASCRSRRLGTAAAGGCPAVREGRAPGRGGAPVGSVEAERHELAPCLAGRGRAWSAPGGAGGTAGAAGRQGAEGDGAGAGQGPGAYGWSSQLWTLERVADVIEIETGVRYHVGHVWKLMRRLGWSWQKPARRAIERKEDEIAGWVREEWPETKNQHAGSGPGSSSRTRAEPR